MPVFPSIDWFTVLRETANDDAHFRALRTSDARFGVKVGYFYADLGRFLDHVAAGLYNYGFGGLPGADGINNWKTHASYTVRYGMGLLPFLFGLFGLTLALYRIDRRLVVFLAYPVLYRPSRCLDSICDRPPAVARPNRGGSVAAGASALPRQPQPTGPCRRRAAVDVHRWRRCQSATRHSRARRCR